MGHLGFSGPEIAILATPAAPRPDGALVGRPFLEGRARWNGFQNGPTSFRIRGTLVVTPRAAGATMSEHHDGLPFSESNLDSVEYRQRLMRKLNCLIAVLEVAGAKVRRSLAGPAPDVERLTRIKKNLADTLEICTRARTALEKRGSLPEELSKDLHRAISPELIASGPYRDAMRPATPRGQSAELTSEERAKFERLGKIERADVASCDLDELARRFQA